ncbi:MAG TPA: Ku protein [Firmicutes bacterium]|nr:Ku protein [Candidatus Fermentithermobacillaceae bacterium]
MRPLWNGTLTFGLVVIPVRLYAATERKSVSFRLLHKECGVPVKYMKWCPNCEKELAQDDIVRAYEYQKGEHVIITDEDMEAIPGPSAHVIEILDFVTLKDVDPVYYEKSFFLEPQKGAEKAYSLLLKSMEDQGKVALSRVAIRAKETLAIVRTYKNKFLLLETMYWADEVRTGEELNIPERAEVGERELAMAKTLIETLSADFEPDKYHSRQREAVAELIQRKIQGKEVVKQPEVRGEVIDLMEALRRSVEKAKGEANPPEEPPARPRRRRKASGETQESAAPPPS